MEENISSPQKEEDRCEGGAFLTLSVIFMMGQLDIPDQLIDSGHVG